VKNENGSVKLASQHLAERLNDAVEDAEETLKQTAETAAQMLDMSEKEVERRGSATKSRAVWTNTWRCLGMSDDGEQASLDEVVEEYAESSESSGGTDERLITGVAWSEIPHVPEDWEVNNIESDIEIQTGDNFSSEEFDEEDGIPLIRIRDLGKNETETNYVGEYDDKHLIEDFDLLVGMDGEFEPHFWLGGEALLNQRVCKIEPKSEYDNFFLRYAMEKPLLYIQKSIAGTTVKHLSQKNINRVNLPTPPLPEQRKIASVLYNVDEAIRTAEEIIERTKRVKKGVRERLLTTGTGDAETEEVRFGPVRSTLPENWKKKKIDEIYADRNLGTTERGTDEEGRTVPLTKMGNLEFGSWNWDEVEKISRDEDFIDEYRLEKGDLLFNTRNTPELVGKTAVWDFDYDAVYDNNLLRLRFNENIYSGHFVNYYLSSEVGRRQLRARVHGTTSVAAIYWKDLKKTEVPVPPREEQKEIVETLRDLDDVIVENEEYADPLHRLKRALMQDLLTGEVRTKGRDIDVLSEVEAHG
jgi:type I restriction enzyme S subunit